MTEHVHENLSSYLDGSLPAVERNAVDLHLHSCAECSRHLDELSATDRFLRALPEEEAPPGYYDSLPSRVRIRLEARRSTSLRPWLWSVAAALALLAVTPTLVRRLEVPVPSSPATFALAPLGPPSPIAEREEAKLASRVPPAARDRASSQAESRAGAPRAMAPAPALQAPPQAAPGARGKVVPEPERLSPEGLADGVSQNLARQKTSAATPLERDENRFEARRAQTISSPEEGRALREKWRSVALDRETGPLADEARVNAIEAALRTYRLSGEERDLAVLRSDADEYLRRKDARQGERVRALLRELETR